MRIQRLFVFALGIGVFNITAAQTRKVVFIIADGIPADVIEKSNLPVFKSIASSGGYTRLMVGGETGTYNETPTISAVGYNTVLTGTWVNKHNVWDNNIAAPNYNYPTIFRLFKNAFPSRKIGIYSSWTDNRLKLVGEGLSATNQIKFDYVADGFELDTINIPHDSKSMYMHGIDERVADAAAAGIQHDGPDLSWVYLEYTDDMGHAHGDSPEFLKALAYTDQQVGRIYQAILEREKKYKEEWMMVITTDHGRDSVSGKNHGGQSAREKAGWMITNYKPLNERFHSGNGTQADIMPGMLRFLQIDAPASVLREIDGIPFIGSISLTSPSVHYDSVSHQATVRWKAVSKEGKIKIFATAGNNAVDGAADTYTLLSEVPVSKQETIIDLSNFKSQYFKILLEGKHNTVNCWIAPKQWGGK